MSSIFAEAERQVLRILEAKYPYNPSGKKVPYRPFFRFMESAADRRKADKPTSRARVLSELTQNEAGFWVFGFQLGKNQMTRWLFMNKESRKAYFLPEEGSPEVWKKDFKAFLKGLPTEMDWYKYEYYLLRVRATEMPFLTVMGYEFSTERDTRYEDLPQYIHRLLDKLQVLDIRPTSNPLLVQRWAGAMQVRWVVFMAIEEVFEPAPPYFLRHWSSRRLARTTYEGEHFYHEALQQTKQWIKHEGLSSSDFIAREYLSWHDLPEKRKIQLWVGV